MSTQLQPSPELFRVPLQDLGGGDFGGLAQAEQDYILQNLQVFAILALADRLQAEAKRQAALCRHLGRGWSAKAILDRFRLYTHGGTKPNGDTFAAYDWRSLQRAYTNGVRAERLSAETRKFWRGIYARFRGRSDALKAAYHHLIHHCWLAGEAIPGLPEDGEAQTLFTWWAERYPERPLPSGRIVRPELLPSGWSYDSFRRAVAPATRAQKKVIQFGHFAAHGDWAAQLLRDRRKLRPLECILFDDVRFDTKVLAQDERGAWQSVYPVGIVALDLATGCDLGLTLMPRLKRDDGAHNGITRDGLRLLLYQILTGFGLPPWPVRLVVEKAAAALSHIDQRFLATTLGDRLTVKETSMDTFQRLQGGLREKHGRPWDKGWIEAYFRPLQTHLAGLPGQTGRRYDDTPGELEAAERHSLELCKRAQVAGVAVSALRGRLRTFDEFHAAAREAMALLRYRTDHSLQGFEEVFEGVTADGRYLPILDGNDIPAAVVEIRNRIEAPVERMRRIMAAEGARFQPIDSGALWPLLSTKHPVTIRSGRIRVEIKSLMRKAGTPGDALVYWHHEAEFLRDPRHQGAKLDGYFSDDARLLHVVRDGALLGSVPLQRRVDLTDAEALQREAAHVAADRNRELAQLRDEYLSGEQAEHQANHAHDEQLLAASQPGSLTAALSEAARKATPRRRPKSTARDFCDIMDDDDAPETSSTNQTPDTTWEDLL